MSTLWEKGYTLDSLIESFTVGEDYLIDHKLIRYDCLGSLAHARMLKHIGILSDREWSQLHKGLKSLILKAEEGSFSFSQGAEDVHTAVELALTEEFGEVGKKLHTSRSRNDQIALDLRLYGKDHLLNIVQAILGFCLELKHFAKRHSEVPLIGRTHLQRAMPSSFGLWAGSFLESLIDTTKLVQGAYHISDQCPLGSAAGYGSALPIDRQLTSDLLGFAKVQNNVLYASNSRGKIESIILHALSQLMNDLSKIASDLILFGIPEFGYITLPEKLCSGSSLMPQKRNPDPLELIRAKAATLTSSLSLTLEIGRPLSSGYHRDFQETKGPFIKAFETALSSVHVMDLIFKELKVNEKKCCQAFTPDVFATDQVLDLAMAGTPFREAYKKVALNLGSVAQPDPKEHLQKKTHLGATGNLGLDLSDNALATFKSWHDQETSKWERTIAALLNLEKGGSND